MAFKRRGTEKCIGMMNKTSKHGTANMEPVQNNNSLQINSRSED